VSRFAHVATIAFALGMAAAASASAQVYTYGRSFGALGNGSAQLDSPAAVSIDAIGHRLFVADTTNSRVQVVDSDTLAWIATIGTTEAIGSDNAHFYFPNGVVYDPATNKIFVADSGNDRVQIFDGSSYSYLATLGTTEVAGTDNSHFSFPMGLAVSAGKLYVADFNEERIQIFDTANLSYVATIGTAGVSGNDNAHFYGPSDVKINPETGQVWVTDEGNSRVEIFDGTAYIYENTIPNVTSYGLGFDPVAGTAIITDYNNNDLLIFDGATARQLGTYGSAGSGNGQFSGPGGVVADTSNSRIVVVNSGNNRLEFLTSVPSPLLASVLPGSRAVQTGHQATVFATILNTRSVALTNCLVGLASNLTAGGMSLSYQTTSASTNALTGSSNQPVTIPAGGTQTFVLAFEDTSPVTLVAQDIDYSCNGVAPVAPISGVNTVDLIFSASPVADLISLSATTTGDGTAHLSGGSGFFALATDNVGVAGALTIKPDFGGANLPLTATICETNPTTGACLSPAAASVQLNVAAGATPTFTVFLQASGSIPFAPGTSRVFVKALDSQGLTHGSTSVAVTTN
jgi:DNA-binding beta-propeller fold protein YncE